MLGWHITFYRFGDSELQGQSGDLDSVLALIATTTGASEVPMRTDADHRLAVWQTGIGGSGWLRDLVESRRAACTGRGGYPDTYLIRCEDLRAQLEAGLPSEHATWVSGPNDVLDPELWVGKTTIDTEHLEACDPREWLLAVVWDES